MRFIFERQFQELIERVSGFEAESGENLPPPLFRPEQPGEKRERAVVAGPHLATAQQRVGRGKLLPVSGARREGRAQARAPLPRQFEQQIVVQAEQRALERNRQRKVVLREQQCVSQRHEIDNRDMLGQHQAVGAGNRNARVLQRADDRAEQRAPLAHQN